MRPEGRGGTLRWQHHPTAWDVLIGKNPKLGFAYC